MSVASEAGSAARAGGATWSVSRDGEAIVVSLSGAWTLSAGLPGAAKVAEEIGQARTLRFDGTGLSDWDSGLMVFLRQLGEACAAQSVEVDGSGLPEGARRLYRLSTAVPPSQRQQAGQSPWMITRLGLSTIAFAKGLRRMIAFIGEASLSFGRLLTGRAQFKRADLWLTIQQCSVDALPIVSLISFLVGVILAFVGSTQLRTFGAEIFVADLVGIAIVRDMGAIMAAIVMAGRTGAAFAAQLGTMQVNEEIDALETFGIDPIDFLVLPRLLALVLMLPLLTLYANCLGILGGALVVSLEPTITAEQYWRETFLAVSTADLAGGLVKSAIYGALVALAGCLYGINCGRSAAAVGDATTSAVVTGIVAIVSSCAILTVVYDVIGV